MRILLLADIPPYAIGGAEQQSRLLATAWTKLGHKVVVSGHRVPNGVYSENNTSFYLKKLYVIYSCGRLIRAISFFVSLAWHLVKNKNSYDVIYSRFLGESVLCVAMLKKMGLVRIPVVCVPAAAGNVGESDLAFLNSLPFKGVIKRLLVRYCDGANYISNGVMSTIKGAGLKFKHESTIPNGVEVKPFFPIKKSFELIRFVFVGRLSPQKALDVLFCVLGGLKAEGYTFECIIIGDGPESAALRLQVAALGLSERVKFMGVLSSIEVYNELSKAHYFVLPSLFEGMSNAALEALSCGVPCILSKCGGVDVFIEDKFALLCEPADSVSLRQAILKALSLSPNEWLEVSGFSRDLVFKEFSIEAVARKNIEFLGCVIKNPLPLL